VSVPNIGSTLKPQSPELIIRRTLNRWASKLDSFQNVLTKDEIQWFHDKFAELKPSAANPGQGATLEERIMKINEQTCPTLRKVCQVVLACLIHKDEQTYPEILLTSIRGVLVADAKCNNWGRVLSYLKANKVGSMKLIDDIFEFGLKNGLDRELESVLENVKFTPEFGQVIQRESHKLFKRSIKGCCPKTACKISRMFALNHSKVAVYFNCFFRWINRIRSYLPDTALS
jgi:hypothetical protein